MNKKQLKEQILKNVLSDYGYVDRESMSDIIFDVIDQVVDEMAKELRMDKLGLNGDYCEGSDDVIGLINSKLDQFIGDK